MLKKINQKITSTMDHIFVGPYEKYSLFVTAFVDAIIAILPTDFIVIYYFIRHKNARVLFQSFMIALASVLGGAILYFISSDILSLFPAVEQSQYFIKLKEIINYSIFLQILTVTFFAFGGTIPFTWLSILLGILNISFILVYIPGMFLGRFLRFFLIAWLSHRYGKKTLTILKKYIFELFILILVLVGFYLIYKFLWL